MLTYCPVRHRGDREGWEVDLSLHALGLAPPLCLMRRRVLLDAIYTVLGQAHVYIYIYDIVDWTTQPDAIYTVLG